MYSPRQARIYKGVNGGRFASYGDPSTKSSSKFDHPTAAKKRSKSASKSKSGKQTKHRMRAVKQLTVSAHSKLKARNAKAAAHRKVRARGRWR